MDKAIRAIVVGRHQPDFGDLEVEVIKQKSVTFPATGEETVSVIEGLMTEAVRSGAALLFQTTPSQVTAALVQIVGRYWSDCAFNYGGGGTLAPEPLPPIGLIINTPGSRLAGVTQSWAFGSGDMVNDFSAEAVEAIKFANPRAKVEKTQAGPVKVTVDPPMRFKFSHIEWLTGAPSS